MEHLRVTILYFRQWLSGSILRSLKDRLGAANIFQNYLSQSIDLNRIKLVSYNCISIYVYLIQSRAKIKKRKSSKLM